MKIDRYVQPYVNTKNFNGTILIAKSDEILYEKSFGYADEGLGLLNEANTVFQIASVSKNFTAAAILMLEERGKLKTTDRISLFLPD